MPPAWIAIDWGTTHLRAWAMGEDGAILAEGHSERGMGVLARADFEPALLALVSDWLDDERETPVIACGMVGSRQGWSEAPYRKVPTTPHGTLSPCVTKDNRITMHILPGLKQDKSPDVMRGEETQIAGILRANPEFDGVLCLPGVHTKWVRVSAGEIVSFQTFISGEMFALLAEQSALKPAVSGEALDQVAFMTALSDAMGRPQALAANLFGIRAAGLVADMPAEAARARLSGLLIGLELAGAKPYWLGQNVAIVGAGPVSELYRAGLAEQGVPAEVWDVADLMLAGLSAAYHAQQGAVQ
mgnify:CR=1 FL=1